MICRLVRLIAVCRSNDRNGRRWTCRCWVGCLVLRLRILIILSVLMISLGMW